MKIKTFFDSETASFSYVVSDEKNKKSVVIDSVLNYDQYSAKTSNNSADKIVSYIKENNLQNDWILETHIHADHLTASQYLKNKIGGKIAINRNIIKVIDYWAPIFNSDIEKDGSDFDVLLEDNQIIKFGDIDIKIIETPGHTPACSCFIIEDAIFVGDTIFQPYLGTARTDFPGGSAIELYRSIKKILSLPEQTRIFVGHDYPPNNGEEKAQTSVKEQKEKNIMINDVVSEDDFVLARNKKDQNKAVPKLLLPSIQFNLRAGSFGKKEENGINYIKIPINKL